MGVLLVEVHGVYIMNLFYIERRDGSEWLDVCLPTEHEDLARKICHMKASKSTSMVRVATYDDREEDAHVVCLMNDTGWVPNENLI
jgi:hypothetical protein